MRLFMLRGLHSTARLLMPRRASAKGDGLTTSQNANSSLSALPNIVDDPHEQKLLAETMAWQAEARERQQKILELTHRSRERIEQQHRNMIMEEIDVDAPVETKGRKTPKVDLSAYEEVNEDDADSAVGDTGPERAEKRKVFLINKVAGTIGSQFVDWSRVQFKSGDGGKGADAFLAEKHVAFGGPSGGNGGSGGSIYLKASTTVNNLGHISRKVVADSGTPGSGFNSFGANAQDLEILVPIGTSVSMVYNAAAEIEKIEAAREETKLSKRMRQKLWIREKIAEKKAKNALLVMGDSSPLENFLAQKEERNEIAMARKHNKPIKLPHKDKELIALADLVTDGQRVLICQGGKGGVGNYSARGKFSNSQSVGQIGEAKTIQLELKTLADAGFVGCPNAGKSTLLRAISNAKPAVASYPFTTLRPYVGVVQMKDFRMVVADIPGLIEGAHRNQGLGLSFLRHIERSRVLVFVLDGSRGRAVVEDFAMLERELEHYKPGLSKMARLVVVNKNDLPEASQALTAMRKLLGNTSTRVLSVSGNKHINTVEMCNEIRHLVTQLQDKLAAAELSKKRDFDRFERFR